MSSRQRSACAKCARSEALYIMKRRLMNSVVRITSSAGVPEASNCAEATIEALANTSSDVSIAASGGMPLATIATPVRRPRKPGAEKLFLLLPAFAGHLGAGFTLRRVFRLRAHLVAHAVAVRVALLARAGLFGLAVRRLHLRGALQAGLGILRLGAHLLAHAVAARVTLLAFAGLFGAAVRRFELRDAFLATRGVRRLRAVR